MRKLAACILAAAVLMAMAAPACGEGADFVGTWVLEKVRVVKMEIAPALMDVTATLELRSDGTFEFHSASPSRETDRSITGTWTVEEGVFRMTDSSGAVLPAQFEPETERLILKDEPFALVMCREETSCGEGASLR